jgi:predicted helicase
MAAMRSHQHNDAEFAQRYNVQDNRDWKLDLARQELRADAHWEEKLIQCAYRPFDTRWAYFSAVAMDRPRRDLKKNVVDKENLCFNLVRQTKSSHWQHAVMTNKPAPAFFVEIKDGSNIFPLYLYVSTKTDLLDDSTSSQRHPNLAPAFITDFSARLQLAFVSDGCGDLDKTFGPEDVFHYAYAVFYSPGYRARYVQFLKIDFPRLPLTRDVALFRRLCGLGRELVALHLMTEIPKSETRYPVAGDNRVEAVRYSEPANGSPGRVWINATQYFDKVPPEVWNTHIGGYQVCQKWLKDRKGRPLSYTDLKHYASIVAALARTLELQSAIDTALGQWPLSAKK